MEIVRRKRTRWIVLLLLAVGCNVKDPLFCDPSHPCIDPARSYCDLTGAYEPQHIRNTCVASPFDAAVDQDAAVDAPLIDGPTTDGATAIDAASDAAVSDAMPCRRKIAFQTGRTGNQEIFTMNEDGSGPVNITNSSARDTSPRWSPDGRWIGFESDRSGVQQVYVADDKGMNPLKVSACVGGSSYYIWAPTSDVLVVTCKVSTDEDDLYLVNRTGTGSLNLTMSVGGHNVAAGVSTTASIVFDSDRDGDDEIFTMDELGNNVKQLTMNGALDLSPSWSPDGSKIAFASTRTGGEQLYTMNADGTSQTPIRPGGKGALWSPDGTKLAGIEVHTAGTWDIYVTSAAGGNPVNISSSPSNTLSQVPTWSPDGGKVAFESNRTGDYHVYVANANGSGFTDLTTPDDGSYPSWQPACH
jgi:Tol biopolymer transport system component